MPRTKSIPLIHANSCPSQPVAVKSIDKKPRLTPSVSRQRCNPRNVTHSSSISNHFAPHDLPSTLSKRYIYIYIHVRNRTFPPSYGVLWHTSRPDRRFPSIICASTHWTTLQELNNTAIVELVVISLHSHLLSNRLSRNESFLVYFFILPFSRTSFLSRPFIDPQMLETRSFRLSRLFVKENLIR